MNVDLSELRVFVTGGASGIGKTVVEYLLAEGCQVGVLDASEEAVASLKLALPTASFTAGDACDIATCSSAIQGFAKASGGLDCLVCGVGLGGPTASVEDIDPIEWQNVVRVNIESTFIAARAAIPFLKQSRSGSIAVLSSANSRIGCPQRSPYNASKWALNGLTKSIAMELSREGVRANAILPGIVDGPRGQRIVEERAENAGWTVEATWAQFLSRSPFDKPVPAVAIAELIGFLASPMATWITGQTIGIGEYQ